MAAIDDLMEQGLLEFRQTMKSTPKYDKYNRVQLIELLNLKNKQIDSQRSMLYQSRISRLKLRAKLKTLLKIKRENEKLHCNIKKLNQPIAQIRAATQFKSSALKEHAPIILNAVTGLYKLRSKGGIIDNEILFLILGYQTETFFLTDIVNFRVQCGFGNRRWKQDFKACYCAKYFSSFKIHHKTYYYLLPGGRARLENLLSFMFNISKKTIYS